MNKEGLKTRYFVQWDTHARHMCTVLCSLMEHQSLVDLAICCGTNTIHAHKCVLAANSPYFREQLEKNSTTEQIVVNGLDFVIVKSIIEFMYCGETNILDENLKYMIAAAKLFQMRGLQTLVSDRQDIRYEADSIHIPSPMFLPKKPKYPNAYRPLNHPITPSSTFTHSFKSPVQNDPFLHKKVKRKFVRTEAEKACAREAAASRLALEALQKELATTTQMSSFVIEESCTETTVENFIPHSEESFMDNLNNMEGVPLQVVNYEDLNNSILSTQMIHVDDDDINNKPESNNNAGVQVQYEISNGVNNPNKDKLKRMLGPNIPGNIEIMYRTNDGDFVNVTDDVLQNLSGDALQYQIVDENGQIRELREFHHVEQANSNGRYGRNMEDSLIQPPTTNIEAFSSTSTDNENYLPCSNVDLLNTIENAQGVEQTGNVEEEETGNYHHQDAIMETMEFQGNEEKEFDTTTDSSTSFPEKINEHSGFLNSGVCLSKPVESTNEEIVINRLTGVDRFLNIENFISDEDKENRYLGDDDNKKLSTHLVDNQLAVLNNPRLVESTTEGNWCVMKGDSKNLLEHDGDILDYSLQNSEQDEDDYVSPKKTKLTADACLSTTPNYVLLNDSEELQIMGGSSMVYSPIKTRSSFKMADDIYQGGSNIGNDAVGDDFIKYDKPRRIMPRRKKKSL